MVTVSHLLDATYEIYYANEVKKLLSKSQTFDIAVLGDGATIKTVPQINVLDASANNPGSWMWLIDSTKQITQGRKKDAGYIAQQQQMLPIMSKINSKKSLINVIAFNSASNV